ncbi:NrfD/PsrC family molybdoenzyme membrane anchor subunit [Natrinema sp. DC36]|uniref:NrfD/PsrC family molybdoenzyme membrane anchor subunit n=1 Tax=Natrinema sp. DC36 TaxID=2878680 RepID=UPI001CF02E6A|nr:NrfD/PsrC family molybdoenzyme membrane anchor subunit [Natrinema sp. DC36]
MSTKEPTEADILRPINTLTTKYFIMYGVAALGLVAFLIAWAYQLQQGLIVTGLGDWGSGGGSTWGLYIGAFIWWVGVAHGGIILSAAVRLLNMDRYMPVARLAEMTTIGGLSAAGFYILVHMGRPDRMVTSVIGHYHITVNNSPLVWDVTVITAYFVLSATYLGLTLRYDVNRLRDDLPDKFEPIYKILTIGYSKKEDKVIDRMVWWLAAAVIIMAPLLLHGGVIPWLFALLPAMPGWTGAIQGPMFLSIALMSAISGIMIISYAFRRAYDWDHIITDDIFRGLLLWLGFFTLLFLWFQLQTIINGVFLGPTNKAVAIEAKIGHPVYQVAMTMIFGTLVYIFLQGIRPALFSKKRALLASGIILAGTLTEKILFVVEGFLHPTFDIYANTPGTYFPSLIEWLSLVGTTALVALLFLNLSKLVPVVELHAVEHLRGDHAHDDEATEPEVEA